MSWRFIRVCVLTTGISIVALLALKGIVTGEAELAFMAVGTGFAFGKIDKS